MPITRDQTEHFRRICAWAYLILSLVLRLLECLTNFGQAMSATIATARSYRLRRRQRDGTGPQCECALLRAAGHALLVTGDCSPALYHTPQPTQFYAATKILSDISTHPLKLYSHLSSTPYVSTALYRPFQDPPTTFPSLYIC